MPAYSDSLAEYIRHQALSEGAVVVGFTKIRQTEPVIVLGFPFTNDWFLRRPLRVTRLLARETVISKHVQSTLKQTLSAEGYTGHCKTVWSVFGDFRPLAVSAGLGHWGRNGIIVNREYGSGLLFAALFTNAPLATREPLPEKENHCSACGQCIKTCPGKAFANNHFEIKRCLPYCLKGCSECIRQCGRKPSH